MKKLQFQIQGLILLVVLSGAIVSCGPREIVKTSSGQTLELLPILISPLIQKKRDYPTLLKKQVLVVESTKSRLKVLERAEQGVNLASECLAGVDAAEKKLERPLSSISGRSLSPKKREEKTAVVSNETACAYYRMVLTGLYYRAKVVGYQKGLKRMLTDSVRVVEHDPQFEEGGVYRVLGNIYLSVPSFSLKVDAVHRDLNRAYEYVRMALSYGPRNPENLILMGKILWERGEREAAKGYFRESLENLPRPDGPGRRDKELMREAKGYLK